MKKSKIKLPTNTVLPEVNPCDCFWCDAKIKEGDKKELLPDDRGYAHEKCAEEWYCVQMAED